MSLAGPYGQQVDLHLKTELKSLLGQPFLALYGSEHAKSTTEI